ncbi:MAG: deoxycytidylate deaminase, partial [Sphingobacteriales bacterium]
MTYANDLRRNASDPAFFGRIAVGAIIKNRISLSGNYRLPAAGHAYVIRQLKRPEEVNLLRRVYGKNFILISAFASVESRKNLILEMLKSSLPRSTSPSALNNLVDKLIERDESENKDDFGQQLRETFHHADVFIDANSTNGSLDKISRFINAFFGQTDISPSKDEYGMYAAKGASLRSADLSRQVGAAIFSRDGELITQGCNEVPKAFGGTYWDLEVPDHRDVKKGKDPNEHQKKQLLRDLIERLLNAKLLNKSVLRLGNAAEIVEELTAKGKGASADNLTRGVLRDAEIMDLTEYGRVVHAEMCAVCDAARLGRSIKNSILYCTTFPCHNCTKHILASGISRVVYIEPYPKSKANDLHSEEIDIYGNSSGKVIFEPFLGISPFRYRDIFEKGKRKSSDGTAKRWVQDKPTPSLVSHNAEYI